MGKEKGNMEYIKVAMTCYDAYKREKESHKANNRALFSAATMERYGAIYREGR